MIVSPTLTRHELRFVIPDEEVCARSSALLDMLVDGGADPAGLSYEDLIPVAMKMKLTELACEALDKGIPLDEPRWTLTRNGDVEVIFLSEEVNDLVLFRVTVL
jgi:hypothetical protein